MGVSGEASGHAGRHRHALAIAAVGTLLLGVVACGGDDTSSPSPSGSEDSPPADELLGPEEPASGEPLRIGMVSDGQAPAFDARSELRAVEATVEYWNAHRAGIGGRPIELVTCETHADPAGGTDCGNQMVEEDVVAVALGQSTVAESVWEPLHEAGIPTLFSLAIGDAMLGDPDTSFVLSNPLTTAFGLPISVAQDEGADKVTFVLIDVPQALTVFEGDSADRILENAGLDYDVVKVPPGTADMTSQMAEVVEGGAGVVQVVGHDAFCISALQGLHSVGYEGAITGISQCFTDATREAIPGDQLEGTYVTSTIALGATDDPTYQLYEAVMDAYGDDVEDVDNNVPMAGYTVMASLASALDGISGDVTPATVTEAIKAMPEQEMPGGGGASFRCGGSAMTTMPAVCTNQWLRATLDADGQPAGYEVVDSTEILAGL